MGVLAVLLIDAIIPLRAANAAICGTGICIVMCEGTHCDCGHVGTDYVECYCDGFNTRKYC